MKRGQKVQNHLGRDLTIILLSIVIAILLLRIGVLEQFLTLSEGNTLIGSFIAGIFFTSAFTLAPASIILAKLAEHQSLLLVALSGAFGAMIGDLILFLFIRDSVADDIRVITKRLKLKRFFSHLHLGFLKIIAPVIGALIIASPLPDEFGIALMGISKTRTSLLIPIAFVMNFLGILLISFTVSLL